jgi:hypothetical protein
MSSPSLSRYLGVERSADGNWESVVVTRAGERRVVGIFSSEPIAARAYNTAAKGLGLELNVVQQWSLPADELGVDIDMHLEP